MPMNYSLDKQYALLGVKVNAFTIDTLNELVQEKIASASKSIIAHHNLHSIYLYEKNAEFRAFYEVAEYAHIDGMPLISFGKFLGYDLRRENRITYMDWIDSLLMLFNTEGYKVFYLGSKDGVGRRAVENIATKYPQVSFEVAQGYFDVNDVRENESILSRIHHFKPDVLMVGMGMPRQEIWIKNNFSDIDATVILPCGACFDYLAGEINTPPRWMGQYNLEWLHRFFYDPKRLFTRYFIEPLTVFPLFIKQFMAKGAN